MGRHRQRALHRAPVAGEIKSVRRLKNAASFAFGVAMWTLVEYLVHRVGFHHRRSPRVVSSEHRMHHRDPLATSLPKRLMGHAAVGAASSPTYLLVRTPGSLFRWLGFAGGYVAYETTHWRIHHMPHTVSATRRHHHLVHHARSRTNFGVTTRAWDHVLGTNQRRA